MTTLGTEERPLRVAIIGSGPSGFYAADALFKAKIPVVVDMFDRLPTPFGLLRGGVAPDHQKMKTLGNYYNRTATTNPTFSFYGNIKIGQDISIETLKKHYDAIVYAVGAETDKKLSIPGEDIKGSHTATEFVGWYNGHPDYQNRNFNLDADSVAIIGQGNVAIDVTRILAKTPEELASSDITENALTKLKTSKIKNIYLIGRRGPVQAAFTELELKELGELSACDVTVDPADLELNDASQSELDDEKSHKARKNMAVLKDFASREKTGKPKTIHIKFFKSPLEIQGSDHVETILLGKNALSGDAFSQRANATNETDLLPCQLVFRSIGYKGISIPGAPFDEKKGVIPNEGGRVSVGEYAVGWIKRGATGVLGTNKPDSTNTIKALIEDISSLTACENPSSEPILDELKSNNIRVVTYADWQKIDAEELRLGESKEKPREKFTSVTDILEFLDK